MRDLAVLRAAAHSMGEPVYVLGKDNASYFNQLAMAPEEWCKLGIVFLQDEESLFTSPRVSDNTGNTLFFVSARLLGFGTSSASNIVQLA
eukprot:6190641-Pleurochrysis_carterae.AAC.3